MIPLSSPCSSLKMEHDLAPLVPVVEDLHWIDISSEEFLSSLMDAVAAVPLGHAPLRLYRGYPSGSGDPDRALTQVERGCSEARATGSMKYVARFHALRGETVLASRQ